MTTRGTTPYNLTVLDKPYKSQLIYDVAALTSNLQRLVWCLPTEMAFWIRYSRNYRNPYCHMHFRAQISPNTFSAGTPSRTPMTSLYTTFPRHLIGWGQGHPSHPSLPLWRRAFQWGSDVLQCVGPTRWLIRPCWMLMCP